MNREVVKSDYAIFRIPLIDFEIPPKTQKGCKNAKHILSISYMNFSKFSERNGIIIWVNNVKDSLNLTENLSSFMSHIENVKRYEFKNFKHLQQSKEY